MKSIFVFLLFILVLPLSNYSQVGGERIYQFLNISSSARQIALGGEVLTLIDDINQPIWNPATINADLDGILSVNYSSYLAGVNIGSISYAREFSRRFGTMHAHIKYLDYGSMHKEMKLEILMQATLLFLLGMPIIFQILIFMLEQT
jgi:hypothetical protein